MIMNRNFLSVAINLICFSLIMMSCSKTLKSEFEDCYAQKISVTELLKDTKVKGRIIQNYSQQYYDNFVSNAQIYTLLYLDSLHNYYYMYGHKENASDRNFNTRLRYYYDIDSLAIAMEMYDVEIDRSGESNYSGWENNADKYVKKLKEQADQGSAAALYILGMYHSLTENDIFPFDLKKAREYFQKSAEQHNTQSQFMLGIINCSEGNMNEGIALLEEAANQGNEEAQGNLGVLYLEGKKVPADYEKSIKWFSELNKRGGEIAKQALFNLGGVYLNKIKDPEKALSYYLKSAELGYTKAQLRLALEYFNKYSYSSFVDPNEQEGVKWLRMAAEQGDPTAQNLLAILLSHLLVIAPESIDPNYNMVAEGKRWQKAFDNNPRKDMIDKDLQEKILFCFIN